MERKNPLARGYFYITCLGLVSIFPLHYRVYLPFSSHFSQVSAMEKRFLDIGKQSRTVPGYPRFRDWRANQDDGFIAVRLFSHVSLAFC